MRHFERTSRINEDGVDEVHLQGVISRGRRERNLQIRNMFYSIRE